MYFFLYLMEECRCRMSEGRWVIDCKEAEKGCSKVLGQVEGGTDGEGRGRKGWLKSEFEERRVMGLEHSEEWLRECREEGRRG